MKKDITEYGDNLHVLLFSKVGEDWETFASWYSIKKNLPYASTSLIYSIQEGKTPFQLFQWAKRLAIPSQGLPDRKDAILNMLAALYKSQKFNKPILIVPPLHVVLKPLPKEVVYTLNSNEKRLFWDQKGFGVSTLTNEEIVNIWNKYSLAEDESDITNISITAEAKETEEPKSLISYQKGCGKWIHTKRGCPFASAGGLIGETMTINEQFIIDLWRKMVPLYSSVN